MATQALRKAWFRAVEPRQMVQAPQKPKAIIARPRPTIRRKAQKTMNTGGRSSGAKASSPWISASTEPPVIQLPILGIDSSQ